MKRKGHIALMTLSVRTIIVVMKADNAALRSTHAAVCGTQAAVTPGQATMRKSRNSQSVMVEQPMKRPMRPPTVEKSSRWLMSDCS